MLVSEPRNQSRVISSAHGVHHPSTASGLQTTNRYKLILNRPHFLPQVDCTVWELAQCKVQRSVGVFGKPISYFRLRAHWYNKVMYFFPKWFNLGYVCMYVCIIYLLCVIYYYLFFTYYFLFIYYFIHYLLIIIYHLLIKIGRAHV